MDRSLLVMDVVRITADRGCEQEVARELKRLGASSVAHLQDDDLIDLFVYLDHELVNPEQRWNAV
ncbi:hypothetical protein [Stenotrophomonas sp. 364]|uniref:hypothetical protein n=1 Tax=Stenotrophomonas sp. 364 TaxID=2691571 RepID=UPI001318B8D7|nr:hypothetical protein [Stenotrophomonas sp. 364]QHB72911.1 hypothetical protein GQ674_17160 [Stenotrophomonas sp. 364]